MKYLLMLLIFLAAIQVNAQTGKGSWIIGGSMRVQRSSQDFRISTGPTPGNSHVATNTSASFTFNPTVGYFLVKNLVVGVQGNYSYTWLISNMYSTGDFHERTLGVGPVVRYYVPFGKFAIFPEISYSYSAYKRYYIDDVLPVTYKSKSDILRGGIGAAWFVSPYIGLEGILAYQKTDVRKTDSDGERNLYFNFGIQVYLPKKTDG